MNNKRILASKIINAWQPLRIAKFSNFTQPPKVYDDIDAILNEEDNYPNLHIDPQRTTRPLKGHNVVVIQPWNSYSNFDDHTDPELQLAECVSLGNTIKDWHVIGKKILFSPFIDRKHIVKPKAFEELKESILSHQGVSAVFFGVEVLSGIQLITLEKALRLPVYDRFTVVLNIFRQHARTKEARIQLALAELPYIRANLREIHESSEYSSTAESIKMLVGGVSEKMYHERLAILKQREQKLRYILGDIHKQRSLMRKQRKKSQVPTISVVGYTNCGKTSLIKHLTGDEDLEPKDQLFATLDVTVHEGQLPSSKSVYYLDTVGFLSRVPILLIEAFSATLKDIQETDLILHVVDITHPDSRFQYATVMRALKALKIPSSLLETKLTVGNKVDLINRDTEPVESHINCDFSVSATKGINMEPLSREINDRLMKNVGHKNYKFRIDNGGDMYYWLRKHGTMIDCIPDPEDGNYLICEVILNATSYGRWTKKYGSGYILED